MRIKNTFILLLWYTHEYGKLLSDEFPFCLWSIFVLILIEILIFKHVIYPHLILFLDQVEIL